MILVLRFIGVMNAAIWFGSAVFLLVSAPVFFSEAVRATPLGEFWPGIMISFVFERFFFVQCICGAIAIAHQLAEWVYLGRALQTWVIALLGALLLTGLFQGLIIQPRIRSLNLIRVGYNEKYAVSHNSQAERDDAKRSFKKWHGLSSGLGLVATLALGVFFWKVVHPGDNPRFISTTKFRS